MPNEKRKYRAKLTVKTVGTPRSVRDGQAEVLSFSDEAGTRYSVWDSDLKPFIVAGSVLDADISESPNTGDEGQTYVNRNITQLYVDGQPVKQRGRGGYKVSPQQIASEETRTAVGEILRLGADHMTESQQKWLSRLFDEALGWCEDKLKAGPAPAPAPAAKKPAPALAPAPAPAAKKPAPAKAPPQSAEEHWESLGRERDGHRFDNAGQFFTAVFKELGINQTDALTFLEVKGTADITNFDNAWNRLVELTTPAKKR